jgi:hypothetical protein
MGKQIIHRSTILTAHFYALLINNIIVFFAIFFKTPSFLVSIILVLGVNIFGFLVSWNKYHNFEYDQRSLLVTNSWNPYVSVEMKIKSIQKISMEYRNQAGFEVMISWRSESKGFWRNESKGFIAGYIEKEELQEMIDDINKMIQK